MNNLVFSIQTPSTNIAMPTDLPPVKPYENPSPFTLVVGAIVVCTIAILCLIESSK